MIKFFLKIFSGLITIIILGIIFFLFVYPKLQESSQETHKETFIVRKVIDGDTYLLSNNEKVRLLGIDTPEKYESNKLDRDAEISGMTKKTIKKLGELATQYSKKLVEGKTVYLEKEPNYSDRDKYGRLLRYVYLEDGTFVNAQILKEGYATVYDKYQISKLDEFRKLYREARENRRGLWGDIEGLEQFN